MGINFSKLRENEKEAQGDADRERERKGGEKAKNSIIHNLMNLRDC